MLPVKLQKKKTTELRIEIEALGCFQFAVNPLHLA